MKMQLSFGLILITTLGFGCGPTNFGPNFPQHKDVTDDFLTHVQGNYVNASGWMMNIDPTTRILTEEIPSSAWYPNTSSLYDSLMKNGQPVCSVKRSRKIKSVGTHPSLFGETRRSFIDFEKSSDSWQTVFLTESVRDAADEGSFKASLAKRICRRASDQVFHISTNSIPLNSYSPTDLVLGIDSLISSDTDPETTTESDKVLLRYRKVMD